MTPARLAPSGRPAARVPSVAAARAPGHSGRRAAGRRPGSATALVATVVALNVVGLVMVTSASSVVALERYGSSWAIVQRHALFVAVGFGAFALTARLDYHHLRRVAPFLLAASLCGLLLVFVPGLGVRAGGATRWIGLGPVNVQPSELAKLALLVFGADLLARRAAVPRSALRPVLVALAVFALLVMSQPDMGTALILALIAGVLLFAGGIPLRHLAALAAAGGALLLALAWSAAYRRARLLSFRDPFADPAGAGYQAVQSLIALGSGGLVGVGLGAGRSKWLFLPNAHTDFIFAVIGEELGLLGALLVVALFATLGLLGFRAALRAPDRFGFLLAVTTTVWLTGQAAINVGAAIGLLPITGVPLPFVSFGGSALVVSMAAAGIVVNVARQGRARGGRTGAPRSHRA